MMTNLNVTILTSRLASGDETAFYILYDLYWEQLYIQVIRIVKDSAETEDIVQDVFSTLWRIRASLTDVQDIKPYLFTIARNHAVRRVSHSKRLQDSLSSFMQFAQNEVYSLDKEMDNKELLSFIDMQIKDLPEKMREIFTLSRKNGLSNKEIAELLHISENTVKKQINNSIKRIRESLHILSLFL